MKHYVKMANGDEYDLLDPKTRRYVGHSEEFLAKTKRRYRKRERAAMKRMLLSEVADESITPDEVEFYRRKLQESVAEYRRLQDDLEWADEYVWEHFGSDGDWLYDYLSFAVNAEERIAERRFDDWMDARHELAALAA